MHASSGIVFLNTLLAWSRIEGSWLNCVGLSGADESGLLINLWLCVMATRLLPSKLNQCLWCTGVSEFLCLLDNSIQVADDGCSALSTFHFRGSFPNLPERNPRRRNAYA